MTLAYPSGPTTIRLVYKDNHNKTSVKDYIVPTGVWDPASGSIAALTAIRDALVVQVNLNTLCLILNAFISIKQTDDTLTIPAVDCHVNETASIVTNLDGGEGKKTTIKMPGPVVGMFVGASGKNLDIVDVEDTDLNTFLDMFQTTGGSFTVSDGETLADVTFPADSGRRLFAKTGAKNGT